MDLVSLTGVTENVRLKMRYNKCMSEKCETGKYST